MGGSLVNPELSRIIDRAEATMSRFQLCTPNDRVLLALSGGKDSLVALMTLREMGIEVYPVIVDMGYEKNWGPRLDSYVTSLGFEATVLYAHEQVQPLHSRELRARMEILNNGGTTPVGSFTPCTHCYSVKAMLLEYAARAFGVTKVVFGHHAVDAASSLVKEGLMHIDRWHFGNRHFDRSRFSLHVLALQLEAEKFEVSQEEGELLSGLKSLVTTGRIDTDEPPRQPLRFTNPDVEIIRPLFEVQEEDIVRTSLALGLVPEPSGCGHGTTKATETPRQMVHRALTRMAGPRLQEWLKAQASTNIDTRGASKVRARLRRSELLGEDYKPTAGNLGKV